MIRFDGQELETFKCLGVQVHEQSIINSKIRERLATSERFNALQNSIAGKAKKDRGENLLKESD